MQPGELLNDASGLRNGIVLQIRYYWATDTCIDIIKFIPNFKSCKTLKLA